MMVNSPRKIGFLNRCPICGDSFRRFFCKSLAVVLPLLPIIDSYSLPFFTSLSFAEVVVLIFLFLGFFVFLSSDSVFSPPMYLIFLFYIVLSTFFNALFVYYGNSYQSFVRLIRDFLYFLFFCFLCGSMLDVKFLYSVYKWFIVFVCSILFIESGLYYLFHKTVLFILPFFPLNYAEPSYQALTILRSSAKAFRPESCFLEPAYFAYYCIPFLALSLFSGKSKNLLWAIFTTIGILVSKSGTGYILLLVLWFFYFVLALPLQTKKKMALFPFLAIFGFAFLLNSRDKAYGLWSRILELFDPSGITSGQYRIFRGFLIFNTMNPLEKTFGVGIGNISSYIISHGYVNVFNSSYIDSTNTFTYVLICGGFVGLFLFLFSLFVPLIAKKHTFYYVFYFVFVLLILDENIMFSSFYLLYMSLLFAKDNFFQTDFGVIRGTGHAHGKNGHDTQGIRKAD